MGSIRAILIFYFNLKLIVFIIVVVHLDLMRFKNKMINLNNHNILRKCS